MKKKKLKAKMLRAMTLFVSICVKWEACLCSLVRVKLRLLVVSKKGSVRSFVRSCCHLWVHTKSSNWVNVLMKDVSRSKRSSAVLKTKKLNTTKKNTSTKFMSLSVA
ncbi:hypothetical protein D3C86_1958220 [compost metagenome]